MSNDNKYMARYMADRYLLLKIRAIDYKGGQCGKCGYNKCYAALEFHHRDPLEKDVSWHHLRKRKWDSIILELDKCDLLCANCHRETHFDPELFKQVQLRIKVQNETEPKNVQCEYCKNMFQYTSSRIRKYCSRKCSTIDREKINWPDNLQDMVNQSSKSAIARQLGVSDKAIAKRLKNH